MSTRKPYNDNAGYIASRHNQINGGWVVIYVAAEQGIDAGYDPLTGKDYKYATVCETHATICGTSSIPKARPFLKFPEFCEACMDDARAQGMLGPASPNDPGPDVIDAVVTSDDWQADQAFYADEAYDDATDSDEERDLKLGATVSRLAIERAIGIEDAR